MCVCMGGCGCGCVCVCVGMWVCKKISEIKEVSSIGIRTHMSDDACVFISYI